MTAMPISISSNYPMHIDVDPDIFGEIFAAMAADDQVAVLRAMVEHMRPHRLQWDYIAIELETQENTEVRDDLRTTLFPDVAAPTITAELIAARNKIAELEARSLLDGIAMTETAMARDRAMTNLENWRQETGKLHSKLAAARVKLEAAERLAEALRSIAKTSNYTRVSWVRDTSRAVLTAWEAAQ